MTAPTGPDTGARQRDGKKTRETIAVAIAVVILTAIFVWLWLDHAFSPAPKPPTVAASSGPSSAAR